MNKKVIILISLCICLMLLAGCSLLGNLGKYSISGQVTFPDGNGVKGVKITLTTGETRVVETDDAGRWSLNHIKGEVTITPVKEGYTFEPSNLTVTAAGTNYNFTSTYLVQGQVVFGNQALSDVTISFSSELSAVKTDATGKWQREGLYSEVTITPSKDGYYFTPASQQVTDYSTDLMFQAGQTYCASGRITGLDDQGVADVTIDLGNAYQAITTDSDGVWSVSGLAKEVVITPRKDGYNFIPESFTVNTATDDIAFLGVKSEEYYAASGKVADIYGEGLEGVVLNFGDHFEAVTTDVNGMWSKEGLYGEVQIIPGKTGYTFDPVTRNITGTATDLDFVGVYDGEYYTASGKIVDIHGQGISDVQVDFGSKFGFTTTDDEGIWIKEGLYLQVQVTPSKAGYFFNPESITLTENTTNIMLLGVRDDEVYTLTGQVVDPAGQGLAEITIDLGNFGSVITGIDGKWSKAEVYGEVTVTPSKKTFAFEPATLQGSKETSDLTFTGTYTASGRIYDSQGSGLAGVTLSLTPGFGTTSTDEEGYWQKSGLYGDVVVTPDKDKYVFEPVSENLNVTNHDEVDFTGYQLYTVSGTVVSPLNYDQGLANVNIEIGESSVKTDQNGNWSYTWREGSSITALPRKPYWYFAPAEKTFMESAENVIFEAYPNRVYFTTNYPNLFTDYLGNHYYSGCINIEMKIWDQFELLTINEVRFYVDGELFDTVTEANYTTQLDTENLSEGSHTIRIEISTDDCIIPFEEELLIRHLHPALYYDASQNTCSFILFKYEDGTEKFVDSATVLVNGISFIPDSTNQKYKPADETFAAMEGDELVVEIEHPSYNSIVESVTVPFTTDSLQSNDLDAWLNGGPDAKLNLTWNSIAEHCDSTNLTIQFYDMYGNNIGGVAYPLYSTGKTIRRDEIYTNPAYVDIYIQYKNSKYSVHVGIANGCMMYGISAVNKSNVLTNLPLEFRRKIPFQTEQSDQFIKKELR